MTHDTAKFESRVRQVFPEGVAFNRVLGLKVESLDPDAPRLRFDMKPELIGNPRRQILHGGVISAVLDVAAGFAVHLAVSRKTQDPGRATSPTSARSICASIICGPGAASSSSRPGAWYGSATASRSRIPKWPTTTAS